MVKKANQVLQELQAKKFAPVYFLHGDEAFFLDQISDFIEKNALDDSQKGFNQTILYGKDTNMTTLLGQARRFPMMSDRQVLIVKEFAQMPELGKSNAQAMMIQYLEQPQPSTILVMNHKHKLLNKNSKVYKALNKHAVVVESKKLYENQIPAWITEYLSDKGFQIDEKARVLLVESIGADLSRMSSELDKLILNLQANQKITEDLIEKYVGISKDYNVFEFQKALISKDLLKAKRIINYWTANPKKQALIPTLALLYNFFAKVLLAYAEKDRSDQNLSRALGVNAFFVRDYKTAMQNFSLMHIIQIIALLRKADLQAKGIEGVGLNDGDILSELATGIIFQY